MSVMEIREEYQNIAEEQRSQKYFFEFNFQENSTRDQLGCELAQLLMDRCFRAKHVPGLLRFVCLSAEQYQGDFWKNFMAKELCQHTNLSQDEFYEQFFLQGDKLPFFSPFEKWCEGNKFRDRNFRQYYTRDGNALWRVRLVNDQCGLMLNGEFPRQFFKDYWLDDMPNLSEQALRDQYDGKLEQYARRLEQGGQQDAQAQKRNWGHRRELLVSIAKSIGELFVNFHGECGRYPSSRQAFVCFIHGRGLGDRFARRLSDIVGWLRFRVLGPTDADMGRPTFFSSIWSEGNLEIIRPMLGDLRLALKGQSGTQSACNVSIRADNHEIFGTRLENGWSPIRLGRLEFDFWDVLTLSVQFTDEMGGQVSFQRDFKWESPGLFLLEELREGQHRWRRLDSRAEAIQCMAGSILVLVPGAAHGMARVVQGEGIAHIDRLGCGLFKITVAEPQAGQANTFGIKSDNRSWGFIVPVPHAEISVIQGRIGSTDGPDGNAWGRVLACRTNPLPHVEVGFDDPCQGGDVQQHALDGACLVLIGGWRGDGREHARMALPRLVNNKANIDIGEMAGSLPEGEYRLRIVSGRGTACSSDMLIYLLEIDARIDDECLFVCQGGSVRVVARYGAQEQSCECQWGSLAGAHAAMSFEWAAQGGRKVRLDRAFFRLTGFIWLHGKMPLLSFQDFMGFCQQLDGVIQQPQFMLADDGSDQSRIVLGQADQTNPLELRLTNRTQGMAHVCWSTNLNPGPCLDNLRPVLAGTEFVIWYESRHVGRIQLASVSTLPQLPEELAFSCRKQGADLVSLAGISIGWRVGCLDAKLSVAHWPEHDQGNIQTCSQDFPAQAYPFVRPKEIIVELGRNLPPGVRIYQAHWQAGNASGQVVLQGKLLHGGLAHLDSELAADGPLNDAWHGLMGLEGWLDQEFCGLFKLFKDRFGFGNNQEVSTVIVDLLASDDWPRSAIAWVNREFPRRLPAMAGGPKQRLYELAHRTGQGMGHPCNPVLSPSWYGLLPHDNAAAARFGWLAATLVAAQVRYFRNAGVMRQVDHNALVEWRTLVAGLPGDDQWSTGFRENARICLTP